MQNWRKRGCERGKIEVKKDKNTRKIKEEIKYEIKKDTWQWIQLRNKDSKINKNRERKDSKSFMKKFRTKKKRKKKMY